MHTPLNALSASPVQAASQGSASGTSFTPSKPILPRLIHFRETAGKIGDRSTHLCLDRLEREHVDLQIVTKEQFDLKLNQTWMDQAWSYLTLVSTAGTAIFNFVMGASLLDSGHTAAGSALIAISILEIAKELFTHYGIWDRVEKMLSEKSENAKEQLKRILPLLIAVLNFACLSVAAQNSGIYEGALEGLKWLSQGLQTANSGAQSYFSYRKAEADVQSAEIKAKLDYHKQNAELLSRLVTTLIEETRRVKTTLKKPILSMIQAGTIAAQKI